MEKFGRIALKTILWIVASVIFLVLLVFVLIQVPAVQQFAKNKAVNFLEGKIHTKVQIGHITLGLPKLIVLENVYFEDQKRDTLLAGDKLKVDIDLLKLIDKKVEVNEINLQGITTKISRDKDSTFNFDYIIKAFAGEQKKEPKPEDTTSTMKFALDKIILDRINVSYKDVTTGNNVKFLLGHFDTRIKDFDLDKMKFSIPKINLSDVDAVVIQTPSGSSVAQAAAVDTATKPMNLTLNLGTIDLNKIKVNYRTNEMKAHVNLGAFTVEMDKIDLKNQKVGIKSIELNDTRAGLTLAKPQTVVKAVVKTVKKLDTLVSKPQASKGWSVALGKLTLANNDIRFDNDAQSPLRRGLDFAHMNIKDLTADIENLSYNPDTIAGKVNQLTFNDKSGFALKEFHTNFFYGPKNAYLKNLYVETPQTVLQKDVQVAYPSIATLSNDISKLSINANLDGSRLGLRDVLLLMPTMASMEPFRSTPNAVFKINGRIMGAVNNLNIPNFEVSGLSGTHIKTSAVLKGLPDVNKAYFDVNLTDFTTNRSDIFKLAPRGTIPTSVSIPEYLSLKGKLKGSMKDLNTQLNLRSSYGSVDAIAHVKNATDVNHLIYAANVKVNNLNAGALTKMPQTVGRLTLAAKVNGSGIDPKHLNVQFAADVVSAQVKGYNYRNLVARGTARNGSYVINARMKDPNINFTLDGKANMNKKYPSVTANLLVDSINLQKLNFVKDDIRFHGKLVADVPTADPDYLNGNIQLTDMLLVNKGQRIQLDTVSVKATANADSSSLRLKTPFLYAHLGGKYKLTEIGTALQGEVNKYFNTALAATPAARPTGPAKYSPEQFKFDLRIVKTPLVTQFAPDLKQLDPILINGSFDSQSGQLLVNGNMPKIIYGTNVVSNGKININTNNNALNYSLTFDQIQAGSSLKLLYPSISGNAQNNKLNLSVQIRDAAQKERYRIAGIFNVVPGAYQFSFLQNGLLLDYTEWAVNPNNSFQYGPKGILARDFAITNNNQVLSITSNPPQANAPLTVSFNNFKIETLTRLAQQDSLLIGGTINGNAVVSNVQTSPVFTSALNINDFNFKGDTVGNIAIKVNNQTANAYAANVSITGKGNQVDLNGLYYTGTPAGRLDLNLNIVNLGMKSIEGFSFGSIKEATGNITGQLKVTGTTSAPQVRGDINFNKVGFNVAMLNSYFSMPNESITFNNEGVRFNDFTLVDSTGNKAIVTGTLYTQTYTDYKFGIDIRTDNFRVINSTQADNKLYYGKLYLDSRIKVRGDMNKPVVDATLTVNDKTDMTFVLPADDPSVEDRKGVVEFIDKDAPKLDSILMAKQLDSLRKSEVTGLDVTATVNINKNANFNVVIDPRNGDVVHIQGEAHLNGGIDPSGKTSLTGTYVVNEGSYQLSYGPVNRLFKFKSGSTITWAGDPTLANINITAVYLANVPPIDLVEDQIGGTDAQRTVYKEKLPFNVNLNLTNQLLTPKISFDIVLPDSNYTVSQDVIDNVNTRLQQIRRDTNELNKQVLGVLVLGHFIGDNPLQSQGGSAGVEGAVRNSVSSLLSNQLNKLAGNLIGGVNLNFDLSSGQDYSTGVEQNRTDLNVGLSKRFLNDRLTVTVGNNFQLEGQSQPGEKTSNIAGNVTVNYRLTKDGRYMLRAYRRDQYIVIQGQVVETGIGFTLTVDYNHFKEIFSKSTRRDKELQKRKKEENKEKKEDKKEQEQEKKEQQTQSEPIQATEPKQTPTN
ncbi:translocation/assembly module TamB [Mucilaginibacter robiniae]|uniref:Translocation/assembly module TamB n=1 Tax=Mucilaginibacter robiniae TaxID=2728022 RepID=A0A7L5E6U1_9SPHI|nr:translocation/assembly module TamB domain-containing protein [Mucilaginibacter robiniae]QJD98059.1 translocation/assembly module TamB [Mucilaginibacter robiniae]